MIEEQILCRILDDKSYKLIAENALCEEHFIAALDEFRFINSHHEKYGVIPSKETFYTKFPDFPNIDSVESEHYLVESLNEERLYRLSVPILKTAAGLINENSHDAIEYLFRSIRDLELTKRTHATDIIKTASERLAAMKDKAAGISEEYISTGFTELDHLLHGWRRGEEFVILFARTGQGKSAALIKTLVHAWRLGNNVGFVSPEMSAAKVGYRADTILSGISNRAMLFEPTIEIIAAFESYMSSKLSGRKDGFYVSTPKDFYGKITISKLREYCMTNKLNILAIDGLSYLVDERYKRGDNKTQSLTNISEDLMSLSMELNIPIIAAMQSNRGGVRTEGEDTPDLENIRDSDGPAQNASKVISIRQLDELMILQVRKHRDGPLGKELKYQWKPDIGDWRYVDDMPITKTTAATPAKGVF